MNASDQTLCTANLKWRNISQRKKTLTINSFKELEDYSLEQRGERRQERDELAYLRAH